MEKDIIVLFINVINWCDKELDANNKSPDDFGLLLFANIKIIPIFATAKQL